MIGIVDYGLGNVRAIANIYESLKVAHCLASTPDAIMAADRLILPGVGAFDGAMDSLSSSGLLDALNVKVRDAGCPVLGICVGMQMMARRSDEGQREGLGWVNGEVVHLASTQRSNAKIALPHMGWNDVQPKAGHRLFAGLDDARFYFLHTYCFRPLQDGLVIGETAYHGTFASAFSRGNVYGVQFHPEKSHHWGVRLLANFAGI